MGIQIFPSHNFIKKTLVDLLELDMTDFNIILGMDWINFCYDSIKFRNRVFQFYFLNEPILEWNDNTSTDMPLCLIYLGQKNNLKKCIYHLI